MYGRPLSWLVIVDGDKFTMFLLKFNSLWTEIESHPAITIQSEKK